MSDPYPCQDGCPVDCIIVVDGWHLQIDTEECIMCEVCCAVCPVEAIELNDDLKLQILIEYCLAWENDGEGQCKSM